MEARVVRCNTLVDARRGINIEHGEKLPLRRGRPFFLFGRVNRKLDWTSLEANRDRCVLWRRSSGSPLSNPRAQAQHQNAVVTGLLEVMCAFINCRRGHFPTCMVRAQNSPTLVDAAVIVRLRRFCKAPQELVDPAGSVLMNMEPNCVHMWTPE